MPTQTANHNLNVVSSLKTELLHATQGFKTTLELRSSKMKDQQEKKLTLADTSTLSPLTQMLPHSTPNSKEKFGTSSISTPPTKLFELSNPYALSALNNNNMNNNNINNNQFDGSNHSQQYQHQSSNLQQQQLMLIRPPVQYQYYDQRQESVDEVAKTIGN